MYVCILTHTHLCVCSTNFVYLIQLSVRVIFKKNMCNGHTNQTPTQTNTHTYVIRICEIVPYLSHYKVIFLFGCFLSWYYPNPKPYPNQTENKKDICKNIVRSIPHSTQASVTAILIVLEVTSQLRNTSPHTHTHRHTKVTYR